MTDVKRRIQRQELMDRMTIIDERIKSHLSQAQRADTHIQAYMHYANILELVETAQAILTQIKAIDTAPIQEKML